jgi:signal transduction histidine kinase
LVNNYLDVSTIEAGQLKLVKRPVNLSDLLRNIVQRFGWESDARSICLEVVAQDCPGVEGDVLLLERVFGNLLQNALKFTPDGGRISVQIEPLQGESLVSVRNSGPGIDPEKFSFLFQKFQRLDNDEHRQGLGLGLYIVKELVEAHGGRVKVNSTLSEGNCFSVFLPLSGVAVKGSKEGVGFVMEAK